MKSSKFLDFCKGENLSDKRGICFVLDAITPDGYETSKEFFTDHQATNGTKDLIINNLPDGQKLTEQQKIDVCNLVRKKLKLREHENNRAKVQNSFVGTTKTPKDGN